MRSSVGRSYQNWLCHFRAEEKISFSKSCQSGTFLLVIIFPKFIFKLSEVCAT